MNEHGRNRAITRCISGNHTVDDNVLNAGLPEIRNIGPHPSFYQLALAIVNLQQSVEQEHGHLVVFMAMSTGNGHSR